MKTLESSIALRLLELTAANPSNLDAFVNHLTILDRAEDLKDDGTLLGAVNKAAEEFSMTDDAMVQRVVTKLVAANDPLRAEAA